MQVVTYGISVEPGHTIVSNKLLFEAMERANGAEDKTKDVTRTFYLDTTSNSEFYLGLVATFKDRKKYLEFTQGGTGFHIKVSDIKGNSKQMEFNFFVVSKSNGLGLFQYYRGSCSANTFGEYLKRKYKNVSAQSRDLSINTLKVRGEHTIKAEKGIRRTHAKGLKFGLLIRSEDISTTLSRYKSIKAVSYDLIAIQSNQSVATPISGYAKRIRQRVTFKPKVQTSLIAIGIGLMKGIADMNTARVEAVDSDGDTVSLRVMNMPENFGEQDFDDLAQELDNLNVVDFAGHAIFQKLINVCTTQHPNIFMKKIKS
ncbi:hypothetical protein V2I80_12740 [Pseudomonas viridiflava]|uniref:hypothetical protein n=1 Tax=Pseudomonas viridiflava TaxID=33069 RepID=UPI002EB0C451|nr:hypothetical protein [Pseudomonas viridiflava]MEE3972766.1 hypothetical protein [Pseudomonas viridiflava]MEE4019522.1 hypothetical protein [Pseudomonas viridiflava]MEE4046313.1 hypothetical protein [Pseudomonas viridiflava]